jgi:AraC-like DNA-binding protein
MGGGSQSIAGEGMDMRKERAGIQRGVALSGQRAKDWLQARGWRTTSKNPQVFADVFDATSFAYSRTWLGPGEYVREPRMSASLADRVSALLLVEGSAQIGLDHLHSSFGVGDLALTGDASTVKISAQAPVALYEIVTDYTRIGLARYELPATSGPYETSPHYWPALTGVLNQVFGSSVAADDFGIGSIRTAVDSLLLASLKESTAMAEQKWAMPERQLLHRARRIIQDEAHSPALTVARLAEHVRISRAHLHRVFAADQSTPLAEIRAARVELARLHLSDDNAATNADLVDVAQRSGFQTVAAMRRALRRG